MNESVYDLSLDIICEQVKPLVDLIDRSLLPEAKLVPRAFDWEDINTYPGLSLRYVEDPEMLTQFVDDTNVSTNVGYPIILVANWSLNVKRDNRTKKMRQLFESIRRYYMHRRRLTGANIPNVANEISCTVRPGGPKPPAGFKLKKGVAMLTIIGWFMEAREL